MMASYRIVQGFPKALDSIDPRMIDRLEEPAKAWVMGEPGASETTFMDDVIIEHDVEARDGRGVGAFDGLEQAQEEIRILGVALHRGDPSAARIERAREVALAMLPRRWDRDLLTAPRPQRAATRIEVNIGFIDNEHGGVVAGSPLEGLFDRSQALGFARLADT